MPEITAYPYGVSSFGIPLAGSVPVGGKARHFWVDSTNGNASQEGLSPPTAKATIAAAYAKMVADQHDTLHLIAGPAGNNLSAQLVWNLNYTHLVGECAPSFFAQRSRIFQTAAITGLSP